MGILSSIKKAAVKVLDTNQAIFSSPITTLTKGLSAGIAETKAKTPTKSAIDVLKTTAVAAAAILTAGTSAGRAGAVAIGKSLAPKTIKGGVVTAVAGTVAAGALVSSPKIREQTVQAPSSLFNFGADVGKLVESPSLSNAKDVIVENPLASGIIGAGAALLAAPVVIPAVGGILTRNELEEQTQAFERQADIAESALENQKNQQYGILPVTAPQSFTGSSPPIPTQSSVIPESAEVMQNNAFPVLQSDKPRKKRRSAKKISQPLVRISNRNINKLVLARR